MPSSSDPTEPLRAHFRKQRVTLNSHPSPEQIVAYHERRLSPEEAERVRAHLAACPECTEELLELAALLDTPGAPSFDLSPGELESAWERQRATLFPAPPVVSIDRRRRASPSPRWAWATAASLGLAAALLALIVVDQRRAIDRLAQARANPPLVNLAPVDSVRRGLPQAAEVELPAGAERVWIILNAAADLVLPSYEMEIVHPDRGVVLRLADLQPSEAGNFRLDVPRALLAPGDYRIRLIGRDGGERRAVDEFALRVEPPAGSSPE